MDIINIDLEKPETIRSWNCTDDELDELEYITTSYEQYSNNPFDPKSEH